MVERATLSPVSPANGAPSAPEPIQGPRVLLSNAALAVASFWLLLGALYLAPTPLRDLLRTRVDSARSTPAIPAIKATPRVADSPPIPGNDQPPRPPAVSTPRPGGAGAASSGANAARAGGANAKSKDPNLVEPVQDPKRGLKRFARKLAATRAKKPGAITRVTHFGDSLIDLDHITGPLRQRYQKRYGDAGHGFTLTAKPWAWYNQAGLVHSRGKGWKTYRVVGGSRPDYRMGFAGSVAEIKGGTHWIGIRATKARRYSRFELNFLRQAGGGTVSIRIDDKKLGTVNTSGRPRAVGTHVVTVPDTPEHKVRLVARGRVRLLGAVLERKGPGIVWDNLAMVSVRFHQLRKLDKKLFIQHIKRRAPDLVIFQYGANDTLSYGGSLKRYGDKIADVLDRLRAAIPDVSCLVIGPLDRLQRGKKGLYSPLVVRKVSDRQREVAFSKGCAFWDGQRGMGGRGSMKWFLKRRLALKDMVHLQPKGGRIVADRFAAALDAAVAKYR